MIPFLVVVVIATHAGVFYCGKKYGAAAEQKTVAGIIKLQTAAGEDMASAARAFQRIKARVLAHL